MNDHVEVLQQRAESPAVGLRLGDVGLERVVVDDHQEQEEHLHDGDDRHHVGNQFPMALPVHVDGTQPKIDSSVTQNMIEPSRPPQ